MWALASCDLAVRLGRVASHHSVALAGAPRRRPTTAWRGAAAERRAGPVRLEPRCARGVGEAASRHLGPFPITALKPQRRLSVSLAYTLYLLLRAIRHPSSPCGQSHRRCRLVARNAPSQPFGTRRHTISRNCTTRDEGHMTPWGKAEYGGRRGSSGPLGARAPVSEARFTHFVLQAHVDVPRECFARAPSDH